MRKELQTEFRLAVGKRAVENIKRVFLMILQKRIDDAVVLLRQHRAGGIKQFAAAFNVA